MKNKIFILLFSYLLSTAISLADGRSSLGYFQITDAEVFLQPKTAMENKIRLTAKKLMRKRVFYKWTVKDATLYLVNHKGETISSMSYEKGYWKEEHGLMVLSNQEKPTSASQCLDWPKFVYVDVNQGILKSPNGFYVDLKKQVECVL